MITGQCTASVLKTYLITGAFETACVHTCENACERVCYLVQIYVRMYNIRKYILTYIGPIAYIYYMYSLLIIKTYYASSLASVPNEKVAHCYRN